MAHYRNMAWLAAGATLIAVSTDLPEIARPGIWLALAFLLRGWRGMPTRSGLPSVGLALYAALAFATRASLPVGGPLYFVIVGGLTALGLVPLLLDRWIGERIDGWVSTLVFPMAYTAMEFLKSRMPDGPATWGSIAYTQYGNLPLMQLAALTGLWGITFVIAWFASTLNWAWERRFDWATVRAPALAFAAVLGAIMTGGGLRLAFAASPPATTRVAVVSFPRDLLVPREMFRIADGRMPVDGDVAVKLERLHDWFFENTEREARAGARLVAWPEMNFLVLDKDEPVALERAQTLAAKEHVYIAMALGTVSPGQPRPFQNKSVLVDPSGRIAFSYLKSRPVIGWEESVMRRGDGHLPVVATGFGRMSAAICFEGDSPDFVRQVGRGEADLWVLHVNDWPAIKHSHFEMAAFRAIENGAPLLRPASFGVSGAFDAFGRAVGETDHVSGGPVLVVDMPLGGVPTAYARLGDFFAWACVAGTAVGALLAWKGVRHGRESITGTALSRA